jgi:plastocyanin
MLEAALAWNRSVAMHLARIVVAAALATAATTAHPAAGSQPTQVEVKLSSFAFSPATLRLPAGQSVTLHLVNDSSGGHNFSAPQFFAASQVDPHDSSLIVKGTVEVPKHASKDIRLVATAGEYPLRCTHAFHSTFGMTGKIVVG